DPARLTEGAYSGTITITTPNAVPAVRTIGVALNVRPGQPPSLQIDRSTLTFTYPRQALARTELLPVSNGGSGTIAVTASTTTVQGGSWLSVTPVVSTVTARTSAVLSVAANPAGLPFGTYRGSVLLSSTAGSATVDVTMTVSARDAAIRLSQSG